MGRKNFKLGAKTVFLNGFTLINRVCEGFTLIEVVIVAAIVGILTLMIVMTTNPLLQLAKAKDSRRKTDIKKISIALEDYLGDHPCYPPQLTCRPGTELVPYMNKIPCDPNGQSYLYSRPDGCSQYIIYTNLETDKSLSYGTYNYAATSPNLHLVPTVLITQPAAAPPGPTATPTLPVPTLTPTPVPSCHYYGCFSGQCEKIIGPCCFPNYQSEHCLGDCGTALHHENECTFY